MTWTEYERHVVGLLCWDCREATRPSHLLQRRCPKCLKKWSYQHRLLEHGLIQAFVFGVSASWAAKVLGCSYPPAHATFAECRQKVLALVLAEREAVRNELSEAIRRDRAKQTSSLPKCQIAVKDEHFLVIEWGAKVAVLDAFANADAIGRILRRRRASGLIAAADSLQIIQDLAPVRKRDTAHPPAGASVAAKFWRTVVTVIRRQARGVAREHLSVYVAECEYRHNHGPRGLLDHLCPAAPSESLAR
jgi:transposase